MRENIGMPALEGKIEMSKLEEMMKSLMSMPEARNKMLGEAKAMCICADCSTYGGTGETQRLFCGIGRSSRIRNEKDCLCVVCPIAVHLEFTHDYYCARGSDSEQRR